MKKSKNKKLLKRSLFSKKNLLFSIMASKKSKIQLEKDKTPHTNNAQRLLIINWLQFKENFALITGSAAQGQKVVAGKKLKKSDAYKDLAAFVTEGGKIPWDAKQAKSRYESYLAIYKKTKKAADGTGWGITEEDRALGLKTIEDKLEHLCPYFNSLGDLFGNRQNVSPEDTQESGFGITVSSDDEAESGVEISHVSQSCSK